MNALRERRDHPDPGLPARDLAGAAAPLQVPPHVLGLRGAVDPPFGILRGSVLAAWRLLRCNPFEPWRLRPGLGADPLPPPSPLTPRCTTSSPPSSSSSSGSCSGSTTSASAGACRSSRSPSVVRAALLPLTFKQFRSMQSLASHAPEMKKLQDRYKGDKERLNQEMMKFYRENKINPFASCLPLLAQLPVFLSLFYMLQDDLRFDICGQTENPCGPGSRVEFLFITDLTDKVDGRRAARPDRALRRLAAALDAADVDRDGQDAAPDLHGAPVHLRHLHHQLPGRPARLLDHDEPVDDRPAGDHPEAARPDAPTGLRARPGTG